MPLSELLPFLLDGESVLPCGRDIVSSVSDIMRAAMPISAVTSVVVVSILMDSDSIPTVTTVSSSGISSLSADISEQGPHCSEDVS